MTVMTEEAGRAGEAAVHAGDGVVEAPAGPWGPFGGALVASAAEKVHEGASVASAAEKVREGPAGPWGSFGGAIVVRAEEEEVAAEVRHGPTLAAVDEELEKLVRPATNASQGLWLLGLSAGLYMTCGVVGDQPVVFLAVLLAVLGVHELGHLAAMRAFGFRDLRMFFIPLVGAGAMGRKLDATGTQRGIVALAGPLPGILLGLGLLAGRPVESELLDLFVVLTLILNFFNLVPLLPFDGGRLVQIVVFSRWPGGELVFRLFAALLLAWLAMWRESVVIAAVAAFMALGAGWHARVAELGQRLRARVPTPRPLSVLGTAPAVREAAIEDTIATMGLSRYAPQLARNVAVFMTRGWERALDTPPGLGASAALLTVHVALVGLGVLTLQALRQA